MSLIAVEPGAPSQVPLPLRVARAFSLERVAASKYILLDLLERTILLTLFGFFIGRLISNFTYTFDLALLLMLFSQVLPMFFVIFRKWSNSYAMSLNPLDWLLAFVGAYSPLMAIASVHGDTIPAELCSLIILCGLLIQISAKIVLWRSFGIVAAVREIKVEGPYRFVRHPMYAGYALAHIGSLLAFPSLWNFVVYTGALLVQIARLLREEQLLLTDESYRTFASRVRYRLLPGVF